MRHYAILLTLLSYAQPAFAGDWGYEGEAPVKPPVEEQSAASMMKSIKKGSPAAASAKSKTATASPKTAAPAVVKTAVPPPVHQKNETSVYTKKSKAPVKDESGEDQPPEISAPNTVPKKKPVSAADFADSLDSVVDKDQQAARCWLQLFQVVSKERMDYPEQKKLEAYMIGKGRLGEKENQELRSILKFWPKLMHDLRDKPELELHYSDLFKALLRLHERVSTEKTNVSGSEYSSDSDMITHLLGLQRIAVNDETIPFTEDAVNAYADMAFFIYEQTHAGRTIEASDNRTLFAKVVVEKFNRAPTDNDRRAMASFDLAWAKFKIIWNSSDESTHKLLMEKLVKSGAGSTLSVTKDPLLDLVLANWPWKTSP